MSKMRSFSALCVVAATSLLSVGCASNPNQYNSYAASQGNLTATPSWYVPGKHDPRINPYSKESIAEYRQNRAQAQQAASSGRILGTLVGAVVGSKIGDSDSERAAGTAIGAVAGQYLGGKIADPCVGDPSMSGVAGAVAGGYLGYKVLGDGTKGQAGATLGALAGMNLGNKANVPAPRAPGCR